MKKRQCKVHWHSERADEDDNNNNQKVINEKI